MFAYIVLVVLWEVRFIPCKLRDSCPFILSWCSSYFEYFIQLIIFIFAWEQWSLCNYLSKNTSNRPNIYTRVIVLGAHKDIRGSVPKCHNLMREIFDRNTKRSCKPEICQFQDAIIIDKKILWFEVTMEDLVLMTFGNAVQQLIKE